MKWSDSENSSKSFWDFDRTKVWFKWDVVWLHSKWDWTYRGLFLFFFFFSFFFFDSCEINNKPKNEDLLFTVVYSDKAFGEFPRYCLVGFKDTQVCTVNPLRGVRVNGPYSRDLLVKAGLHQKSVSPMLFTIVLEPLPIQMGCEMPWRVALCWRFGIG